MSHFITFQWAKFDDDVVSLVSVNKKQTLKLHSQLPFVFVVCNTSPTFYLYLTGLLELCLFFQQIIHIFLVNYGPKIPIYVGIMSIPKSQQNRMPEILCLFAIFANAFCNEALAICDKNVLNFPCISQGMKKHSFSNVTSH